MIKFNVAACIGCNTSDWIKFISWNNQSLRCSRIMFWLQPQILRHFTAVRPEKYEVSLRLFGLSENSDSTAIFLGVPKYWKPSCIVFLFRGLEILFPFFCSLGNQKFWILSCVVWGIRNSESFPVLFEGSEILNPLLRYLGGSEILNPLLCCLGDKKFWISCVVWGSEILNPLLCCLGVRNSESSPLFLGDQKFRILSCVVWGLIRRLLERSLWFLANKETFPASRLTPV